MKIKGFFVLLMLAGCGLMANAVGQTIFPPNIGPLTFVLNGSSGTFQVTNINGQSYCTVTVPSTATMGGGTITLKTSADNGANWFSVSGVPDLGSGGSASQTITLAGTQLTAPVSGKTGFEVVLSGATGAIITGSITCANGSGATGSNSGGGGSSTNATIVAPTNGAGQVIVTTPAPVASVFIANTPAVNQGTSPWVVSTINPSLPAPQSTWPDSTPSAGPAPTASTGAAPPAAAPYIFDSPSCAFNSGVINVTTGQSLLLQCTALGLLRVNVGNVVTSQTQLSGTGANYLAPICDTFAKSTSISSATTTLLISGSANQSIYICLATWQSTGTNASNTIQFEWGQGATCATNTVTIFPAAVAPSTTSGGWVSGWSGAQAATNLVDGLPAAAAVPLLIPANATAYNFCGVTAGTTTAGTFVVWYAVH